MIATHPTRGQPRVLASGVGLRAGKLECAHLATLKDLRPGQTLKLKISSSEHQKTQSITVRVLEALEAGLYEDVSLEVIL